MAWSIAMSCLLEIKPQKFLLKQIQHFCEILYQRKFPATQYGHAYRKSSDGTGLTISRNLPSHIVGSVSKACFQLGRVGVTKEI